MSANSTPDISHVDQLTFILRYVTKKGISKDSLNLFQNVAKNLKNFSMF